MKLLEGEPTKKKQPKVIDFAKKCPSKWSKQATNNTINLPLYAWGAVAEVEASLSGRSQAMSRAVVLGKLRHLKNTLEVCCLNSTASEFTSYGWTLARDYATKVEDEVEQRLDSWQGMPTGVRTSTLVSAQMEHPRPVPKASYDPQKHAADKREACTTYNKCSTVGKCEYELENPEKSCQRKHECSWCRTNKRQGWKHQALACPNKDTGIDS